MHFPRLPDWLIYAAVVVALLIAAVGRQAHVDAPAAPPPAPAAEGVALGPASPFDPAVVVEVSDKTQPGVGTAFSVAASGIWVTARHVVEGCSQAAIVVAPGRGVAAKVRIDPEAETAILTTDGGAPPLPLGLTAGLRRGEQAFHMGFPQGRPGEASSRLIGRENLVVQGRGARTEPVLVWAETGRTDGLKGTLGGLSGAPALDDQGRIYTTAPETTARTLAAGGSRLAASPGGRISADNYGRVADDLRRNLRVAQVVCLTT
jgi:serine protease Do